MYLNIGGGKIVFFTHSQNCLLHKLYGNARPRLEALRTYILTYYCIAAGLGGGFNERGTVEYKRHESDDEFDDFGRRKVKRNNQQAPPAVPEPEVEEVGGGYRGLQWVAGGCKGLQEVAGITGGYRGVTGCYRRLQGDTVG